MEDTRLKLIKVIEKVVLVNFANGPIKTERDLEKSPESFKSSELSPKVSPCPIKRTLNSPEPKMNSPEPKINSPERVIRNVYSPNSRVYNQKKIDTNSPQLKETFSSKKKNYKVSVNEGKETLKPRDEIWQKTNRASTQKVLENR